MAHLRKRYLEFHLKKALTYSALVGVLGQRQTGKTTLIESIVRDQYVTFDEEDQLDFARTRPKAFIEAHQGKLMGLDECQKAPEIFPVLKNHVKIHKKPGQFILSGSIRFTSRKAIQESLTGRILTLELLPMSFAEMRYQPALNYHQLFKADFGQVKQMLQKRRLVLTEVHLRRYLKFGGMPGIGFSRDLQFFRNKYKTHLETLLQRDLQFVYKTSAPYQSLFALLRYLAIHQGHVFHLKEAATYSRLAQNTVKKILEAFEALFLIRRVHGIDFVNSPMFYIEDQGGAFYLMSEAEQKENYLQRLLYSQIFPNVHYSHIDSYQMGHFENKSGKKIPLVCNTPEGSIGFVYESAEVVSPQLHRTADMFLSKSKENHLIILNDSDTAQKFEKNLIQMPLGWLG